MATPPPSSTTLRLFFALWPDATSRSALARLAREVAHHTHGKAPREDNLHLTLAFLGPVAEERLGEVESVGAVAAAAVDPFLLALARIGGSGYRIAWLSTDGVPAALATLHAALSTALSDRGFPVERRMFRPHLTLARHCARAAHRGAIEPIAWRVDRLSLVLSTLAPGGSRYRELAAWPLAVRAGDTVALRTPRRVDALPELVAFTGRFFAGRGIDPTLRAAVDFAIEELFTNMVKHGHPGGPEVEVALTRIPGGVEVTLTDRDVEPFDPGSVPDADVSLPLEHRAPGGLGIHLTRRLVDALEYRYRPERREARITFRKTLGGGAPD
jgi:2'-5' RNA ligase